jgi:hypothetical protein
MGKSEPVLFQQNGEKDTKGPYDGAHCGKIGKNVIKNVV